LGAIPDVELLVAARAGVLTQFRGHRPGPVFADLAIASAGAALAATVGALARLYEREATGLGGWAETSLYDGVLAILPMVMGRLERPSSPGQWDGRGLAEALMYPCADGRYLQLWFGAKGAYEAFLAHMGDPPSEHGYAADIAGGAMVARGARWAERFATFPRDHWLAELAGHDFRCEPVLRPGEELRDPHARETGLSVDHDDPERGAITAVGPVARVTPVAVPPGHVGGHPPDRASTLLSGVRVLDLSAYLAGPVASLLLAELGADVVKVEPASGDAHRGQEPMFSAGQRGKRAVALDLKAPGAPAVLERLFRWGDVVHHNSRVGLAERLGYDEAAVRAVNPGVVYSFASGFGASGPRARLPANDFLMQALSGVEAGMGGAGPPTFLSWGAVDVTGGWMSACAILAALYTRRRSGAGQSVVTSLLGAGMTLKSGAFIVGGTVVEGPVVDHEQTGYGAAYRIYQGADGAWLALAVPDEPTWKRLRQVVGEEGLPTSPPPLRTLTDLRQPAEELLEKAFATRTARAWVAALHAAGVPAEPVAEPDRAGFVAGIFDDPVNRQLGRVVSFEWGRRGVLEQPGLAVRFGPAPRPRTRRAIPELGEHTAEVLADLGFSDDERAALVASRTVATS
jgi:crotonobetainyl-CoA:carnitine CoA-transferase CaiB-like acyl-CoA transferase